jgi:hypothetical protein
VETVHPLVREVAALFANHRVVPLLGAGCSLARLDLKSHEATKTSHGREDVRATTVCVGPAVGDTVASARFAHVCPSRSVRFGISGSAPTRRGAALSRGPRRRRARVAAAGQGAPTPLDARDTSRQCATDTLSTSRICRLTVEDREARLTPRERRESLAGASRHAGKRPQAIVVGQAMADRSCKGPAGSQRPRECVINKRPFSTRPAPAGSPTNFGSVLS